MPIRLDKSILPRLKRQLGHTLRLTPSRPDWIYPDDTFIVSYPRSGSNWLIRLISKARFPDQDWDIDEQGRKPTLDLVPEINQLRERDYPRPRLIKTHRAHYAEYPRVLYIYRDVRDVVVSYYDFMTKRHGYAGTLPMFLDEFYNPRSDVLAFGRWDAHVRGAFDQPDATILRIRYEELHADQVSGLDAALGFLGYTVAPDAVRAAVESDSFEQYRERAKQFDKARDKGYEGGVKGGPGAGKETLTPDQLDRLWTEMGATMEQLGYSR